MSLISCFTSESQVSPDLWGVSGLALLLSCRESTWKDGVARRGDRVHVVTVSEDRVPHMGTFSLRPGVSGSCAGEVQPGLGPQRAECAKATAATVSHKAILGLF